jgi:phage-related protein
MILTDTSLNTYTLPSTFTVKSTGWKRKTREVPIAYKDGGDEIGDKKIATRIITVEGVFSDNSTYLTTINTLFSWLLKTNLQLTINTGYYINVKSISDISNDFFEGGVNRVSKVKFTCICPDPFFYSTSLVSSTTVISASPTTISITNASLYDILPILTITNAANNHSLKIENSTDDNNYFEFIDAAFDNGEALIVDNDVGTVQEESANAIQYMSGNFLRLLPGVNSLVYTGSNCTILFEYYDKYL